MERTIPDGRLPGLDIARAWMMLLGIVVHGTFFSLHETHSNYWLSMVAVVSGTFRMEAFFTISGLLAAKILEKQNPVSWLKNRSLALLVPFFFGVSVVTPIGAVASNALRHHPVLDHVRLDIGHLWFLATLFCCCLVLVAARQIYDAGFHLKSRKLPSWLAQPHPLMVYATAVVGGTLLVTLYEYEIALSPHLMSVHRLAARLAHDVSYTVGQAPYYLQFFLLGYFLVKAPKFCDSIFQNMTDKICVVSIGALALIAMYIVYGNALFSDHEPWNTRIPLLMAVIKSLIAPAACILIVSASIRVQSVPRYASLLSKASYTMYIMHVAVLSVGIQALLLLGVTGVYVPLIVVPATLLTTFAFHVFVVEESQILQLLLNGKVSPSVRAKLRFLLSTYPKTSWATQAAAPLSIRSDCASLSARNAA
jgi:hypothetical protein